MTYQYFKAVIGGIEYLPGWKFSSRYETRNKFMLTVESPQGYKEHDIFCIRKRRPRTLSEHEDDILSVVRYLIQNINYLTFEQFKYTSVADRNAEILRNALNE